MSMRGGRQAMFVCLNQRKTRMKTKEEDDDDPSSSLSSFSSLCSLFLNRVEAIEKVSRLLS